MKTKYAFFDVDETILNFKSIFDFYKFWLCQEYGSIRGNLKYIRLNVYLHVMSYFRDRYDINKKFYKEYIHANESRLKTRGDIWFSKKIKCQSNFNNKILDRLRQHKIDGFKIVLVSGSISYCLEPLKNFLEADFLICTQLESKNSELTGFLLADPVIGNGKVTRIMDFLKKTNSEYDLLSSFAYGDHVSDIPMLNIVGNPYLVVNGNPVDFLSTRKK